MEWLHGLPEDEKNKRIEKRKELYFYRVSEIMAREIVKNRKPDLILCIHLNAAPWPDPDEKSLVSEMIIMYLSMDVIWVVRWLMITNDLK